MMKQIILIVFLIEFFVCSICWANEKITLQLRWDNQFQFAGYYAAKWQGFYEELGLDVTIKSAVTSKGILSAVEEVESGNADFGIGAADILMARDRGVPLVVVASIFQHSASSFFSRKETELSKPSDFLKLKVARRVNDLIDIELQALLKAEGIDPDKVAPYPHQPGVEHLKSGKVDVAPGYSISFPFDAKDANLMINTFRPIKYGIDFYGDSIFTHNRLVRNKADLIVRFTKASLKGWEYALDNPESVAKQITDTLPRISKKEKPLAFNLFQSKGLPKLMDYPEVRVGHINPARWARMHKYLKSIGVLKKTINIDEFIFDLDKLIQIKSKRQQKILISTSLFLLFGFLMVFTWMALLHRTVKKQTKEILASSQLLKESERRFRAVAETAIDVIISIDNHGKIIFWNKAAQFNFGYSSDEVIGKSVNCIIPEKFQKVHRMGLKRITTGGMSKIIGKTIEVKGLRKNNTLFPIELSLATWTTTENSFFTAIIRDISERKRKENVQSAELSLIDYAASHGVIELLQKVLGEAELITGSQIGFFHLVKEDQKTLSLQTWSKSTLANMCSAEGKGRHYPVSEAGVWADCVPKKEPLVHNDYKNLQGKKGLPEGHVSIIRELVVPVFWGGIIVAILGVGNKDYDYDKNDIDTVQVLADLAWEIVARKQTEESLIRNEVKFRSLFENAPLAIIHLDKSGIITACNENLCQILGSTKDKIIGMNTIESVKDETMLKAIKKALSGQKSQYTGEYLSLAGGVRTQIRAIYEPLVMDAGEVTGVMGILEDISEQLESEQKKLDLESQLRQLQKHEAIGALAGGIAHDFNNILFPIVGFAEMLEEDLPEKSDLYESVEVILTGAKRAKDLVEQILTFSRQVEQDIKPLKPHIIIKEVAKLVRSTIPTTIKLKKLIDPKTLAIMADPTQLHQVAMNLITNAYHAMEESGGVLTIRLQTIKNVDVPKNKLMLGDGPHVLLSIGDTGTGMDNITMEKIFDPYFTTKHKGKGTGLGLSVVHGIIKNYKGDISVKSSLGQGTTFDVYIPALEKEKKLEEYNNPVVVTGGDERILLVDDEKQVLRTERMILERLGYRIEIKDSSPDALEAVKADPESFDLVISDMTMPNMTGDQLTKKILEICPTLPIIICTGFSERVSLENIISLGAKALLMKPIIKSKLATTVRNVLDKAKEEIKDNR